MYERPTLNGVCTRPQIDVCEITCLIVAHNHIGSDDIQHACIVVVLLCFVVIPTVFDGDVLEYSAVVSMQQSNGWGFVRWQLSAS